VGVEEGTEACACEGVVEMIEKPSSQSTPSEGGREGVVEMIDKPSSQSTPSEASRDDSLFSYSNERCPL